MVSIPPAARSVLRFWEWPFLLALAGFMFWVRMLPYKAIVGGERAYYIGTDPFYHYRAVLGIVEAFPRVPRWDPWTFYPNGTGTGQFSSLFDWVVALVAIVTSGGDPSDLHVQRVLGATPAVLGALLIVPFYFLAKRLLGRAGAVIASITLALLPGEFLIRSIAGYADHHVAEALMAIVSILAVVVAVERAHAQRDKLVDLRDVKAYRGVLGWSVLAGVALAAEFLTWPPAVLFLGILTIWLGIVVLLQHGQGRTPRGFVFGGAVAFTTAGLLMVPFVETMFLGEFNTYGILHPVASFLAAAGLVALHKVCKWVRMRGMSPWVVPGGLAGLSVAAFFALAAIAPQTYRSFVWGLSWITGVGVQRTTMTIAEARSARFMCSTDTSQYSCVANDFGLVAQLFVVLLVVLAGFVIVQRRRQDILLLLWGFVMYRATTTQIRFSYYVALNIALMVGWLAARISYATGLEADSSAGAPAPAVAAADAPAKAATKGRRTRTLERRVNDGAWMRVGAVAVTALLILPGNVFALESGARPGWESAEIRGADSDLVMWMHGLDWMRANTPDAGVDLGLVVPKPAPGERFDYPPEAYGVLSWWDYGHWIQTVGLRPPVANPFQQAAPFASLYFTERDPAEAERMLDEWTADAGPVRYVMIDDAMATGKYGAITVWANSQNESRARYAQGEYITRTNYEIQGRGSGDLPTMGPEYTEAMMGRLYDQDAYGLSNYRLVWEHPGYRAIGSVFDVASGDLLCLHDILPSRGCGIRPPDNIHEYRDGTAVLLGESTYAYDLDVISPLKIFERVEGARLSGTASPGERVEALVQVQLQQDDGSMRRWTHAVTTTAGADGAFELTFPYSTSDPLAPEDGGTRSLVTTAGPVLVRAGGQQVEVQVSDRAVLKGETVAVAFG